MTNHGKLQRSVRVGLTVSLALACIASCSNGSPSRTGTTGVAGETGSTAGTNGAAGTAAGNAGVTGAAGVTGPAGSSGSGTAGTASGLAGNSGTAGAGGSTSNPDAAAGGSTGTPDASADISPPFDAAGRTLPTCAAPMPNPNMASGRASECDYLLQAIDFEDKYSYATTPDQVKLTDYGTALGLSQINNCGPYCYGKNLTVGIDIVGGGDVKATQGEILVEFPATGPGLPIANANGRLTLAWIMLEGPTAPPFKISAQLIYETSNGIIASTETKQMAYNNWLDFTHAEFKYNVAANTFSGPAVNVTAIGFRITSPANLPKGMEWHGVAYIDHLEIRDGSANNPTDAGQYPFGLQ